MAVKLLFNFSLIFTLLFAPVFYSMSLWYKHQVGKVAMKWMKPEMVVVTIVFFITSLLLMIVGVSCVFSYWGLFNQEKFEAVTGGNFLSIGASCAFLLSGLSFIYFGLRNMMVQYVLDKGILFHEKFLPFPVQTSMVKWESIVDFYQHSDYPNVVFQLIVDNQNLRFRKIAVRVPVFLKEEFLQYMEARLHNVQVSKGDTSRISSKFFSEN